VNPTPFGQVLKSQATLAEVLKPIVNGKYQVYVWMLPVCVLKLNKSCNNSKMARQAKRIPEEAPVLEAAASQQIFEVKPCSESTPVALSPERSKRD